LRKTNEEDPNLKNNKLFQKFRKYFDEFYHALDNKYFDDSKHTQEEKSWTIDKY